MLSNILILLMWPKWVHKHLQEKTLHRFLAFINRKYFIIILKTKTLTNCTGKSCYCHRNLKTQKQPLDVLFLKVSQNSQEMPMPESLFLVKLQASKLTTLLEKRFRHMYFPVNFAKFLETPFLHAIFSQSLWKLIYDSNHPQLSNKKLVWKCLKIIQGISA